jgi:hypothetical protein
VLHDLSEAPRKAFGDNGRDLSGVVLEMELYPMVQRVARKRLIRNAVYRRRAEGPANPRAANGGAMLPCEVMHYLGGCPASRL